MLKPSAGFKFRLITLPIIIMIMGMMTNCNGTSPELEITQTPDVNRTIFPETTSTLLVVTPAVTTTSTAAPTQVKNNPEQAAGLIIFAMGDGQYRHLFAYHPLYLPITRLTADPWDFDYPAISPDGKKIAYCANQYGRWDIFILDLTLNQVSRLTNTDTYNCAPTWSPDGQWLAFEKYQDGKIDILIQSVNDNTTAPIQLTENSGNNHSPAWSPAGREIAFVSDRNGRSEVWLARLDSTLERFVLLQSSDSEDYLSPAWSPDGNKIAWSKTGQSPTIETWDFREKDAKPTTLGIGSQLAWMPDGSGVMTSMVTPEQINFVAYEIPTALLLFPPVLLPAQISDLDWKSGSVVKNIRKYLSKVTLPEPAGLWEPIISTQNNGTGRDGLVKIEGVDAPEPYLSDSVNESFENLRRGLETKLGWDFLATLENALLPLTTAPQMGIPENWLYTGRAIGVNQVPLEAGWMIAAKEEFNGKTYWRVWLKCLNQDGTCGSPMRTHPWDFSSRSSGDLAAFENGGKLADVPEGYWIDFTEFASRYGWQRLPSNSNWRAYFPGIQLNVFVLRDSLTWQDALLQLYPDKAIETMFEPNE